VEETPRRALRNQERRPVYDRDREIRPAEVAHHRKIYSDDLAFTVEQWPAGASGSGLGIVDDFVRKNVANVPCVITGRMKCRRANSSTT
jgi:hypothetical protein